MTRKQRWKAKALAAKLAYQLLARSEIVANDDEYSQTEGAEEEIEEIVQELYERWQQAEEKSKE